MLPQFDGKFAGPNSAMMVLDGKTSRICMWFSYSTLVAFAVNGDRHVSENRWGTTTGKHLNAIDGGVKQGRLPQQEFEAAYKRLISEYVK